MLSTESWFMLCNEVQGGARLVKRQSFPSVCIKVVRALNEESYCLTYEKDVMDLHSNSLLLSATES